MLVTEDLVEHLGKLGFNSAPEEVCGIAFELGPIVVIKNKSSTPETEFQFAPLSLLEKASLENHDWSKPWLIWHTHPSGSTTPSREDLRNRRTGVEYLVVALTKRGPLAVKY